MKQVTETIQWGAGGRSRYDWDTILDGTTWELSEAFATIERIMNLLNPPESVTLTDWEGKHEYRITKED